MGPFLDITDGHTAETGLSSQTGRIHKRQTSVSSFVPNSWGHEANGMYHIGMTSDHVDTVGELRIAFYDNSEYLPLWEDFVVLPPSVYDLFYVNNAMSELTQTTPPATPSIEQALMLLYMTLRDETNTSATQLKIKNDAGTVIAKGTLATSEGTFIKGELESGP